MVPSDQFQQATATAGVDLHAIQVRIHEVLLQQQAVTAEPGGEQAAEAIALVPQQLHDPV